MPRQSHLLTVHTAIVSAAVTAVPGIVALLTGQLLLFPSLGPTAVMLSYEPEHRSARLYNVIVSHIGGLLSGFAAVLLFGLAHAPSVFHVRALSAPRVAAAVLAVLWRCWWSSCWMRHIHRRRRRHSSPLWDPSGRRGTMRRPWSREYSWYRARVSSDA